MIDRLVSVFRALIFVLIGLALCGAIFQIAGYSAPLMFQSIAEGAFLRPGALQQALRWALPLFITAVGVAISFRAGYFNIGAQGQFYMGAIAAAFMAEWLKGAPAGIVIPACFLAGMTGGALWSLWPGLLRLKSGADEVITTLMGNFIAGLALLYVTAGPLKDPSGTGQQASSRPIDAAYRISNSLGLSPTIIAIAILVGVSMWLLVNRTAFGVLSGLAGRNPTMVEWQGARTWSIGLSTFLLSGALAGLASAALYLPIMAGLPSAAIDIVNAAIALFITAKSGLVDRIAKLGGRLWKTS